MLVALLPYVAPLIVAVLGSLGLVVAAWRRREIPGAKWFSVMMTAVMVWSIAAVGTYTSRSLAQKVVWTNLQYVGITIAPLAWLFFSLTYTGSEDFLRPRNVALLSLHPILMQVIVWTNPLHGLFRERVWMEMLRGVPVLGNQMGSLFWLHVIYAYGVMLGGAYVLVHGLLRAPRVYRRQGFLLLLAILVPWLANLVTIQQASVLSYVDLTPFAFVVSGLAVMLGLLRYDLLDLAPVAGETVIHNLTTGIVVLDKADRVIELNPATEAILGVKGDDLLGKQFSEMLPQYTYIATRLREAHEIHDELPFGDGPMPRTFDLRISPLWNGRQQVVGHLVGIQDITRRKNAELVLSRYADRLRILYQIDQAILAAQSAEKIAMAALDQIHHLLPVKRMSVVTFGSNGSPRLLAVRVNGRLSEDCTPWATALSRGDLCGFEPLCVNALHQDDVVSGSVPAMADLEKRLYEEGVRAYMVVPLVAQDQLVGTMNLEDVETGVFNAEHLDVASQIAASLAVALEHARLYAAARQELEERKLAERALRESEASLRQKADDLAIQNGELDAFAHTVAHDLKTPLALLLGYTSFLTASDVAKRPDDLEMCVRAIGQSARKMGSIIDELLLLASVRKVDEVQRTPLDMEVIVRDVMVRMSDIIDERDAEIIAPKLWPIAWGYASWIEEVWANYVSNALKYGGTPPRIELGATVMQDDSGNPEVLNTVRFWVRDNGPGLTDAQRARLFIPFQRLEQARVEGYGLGLSIVQRIMEKLGGVAGIERRPLGEGSVFYFELPEADI